MRAECDHHVERLGRRADLLMQCFEKKVNRGGARCIRNDEQDALGLMLFGRTGLSHQLINLILSDRRTRY